MKKAELFERFHELKKGERDIDMIVLNIHMPTGEREVISNPNVDEKMKYIDKTYNEDLIHCNCSDIYIEEAVFLLHVSEESMCFGDAFEAMKKGAKVKLPSWGGYWKWDHEKQTVIMHTKDGEELDIRETQRVEYTLGNILSDEWIIADEKNCPELGGESVFSFGEAVKYLKRGLKVARKGWNGKGMYLFLGRDFSLTTDADLGEYTAENEDGSYEAEIGDSICMRTEDKSIVVGWLASQTDMLADDWIFVE